MTSLVTVQEAILVAYDPAILRREATALQEQYPSHSIEQVEQAIIETAKQEAETAIAEAAWRVWGCNLDRQRFARALKQVQAEQS